MTKKKDKLPRLGAVPEDAEIILHPGKYPQNIEPSIQQLIEQIIEKLTEMYLPAHSLQDYDEMLKTYEVRGKIAGLFELPEEFTTAHLVACLKDAGFSPTNLGGMDFVWLFKEKEKNS